MCPASDPGSQYPPSVCLELPSALRGLGISSVTPGIRVSVKSGSGRCVSGGTSVAVGVPLAVLGTCAASCTWDPVSSVARVPSSTWGNAVAEP